MPFLLNTPDHERVNLPDPARLPLLFGHDDAQRPFGCRQRLAVPFVGEQDHAVCESMIQFRESEDGAVIIRLL
jgi:hypothetical protein